MTTLKPTTWSDGRDPSECGIAVNGKQKLGLPLVAGRDRELSIYLAKDGFLTLTRRSC